MREGTELSETFIEHYENIVENSSEIQLTHVARGNIFDTDRWVELIKQCFLVYSIISRVK